MHSLRHIDNRFYPFELKYGMIFPGALTLCTKHRDGFPGLITPPFLLIPLGMTIF